MNWPQVLVAVAQVAAGGTIVQGVVALVRRRSELRKLDRESDSVAVETADRLMVMLRTELAETKQAAELAAEHAAEERDRLHRQVIRLSDEIAELHSALAIAHADIRRLSPPGLGDPPRRD